MGFDPITESGECEVLASITFDVWGDPAPQGSKKGFVGKKGKAKGKVMMVEMSKKVKPWRARIKSIAKVVAADAKWVRAIEGPVKVRIDFFMQYPQSPKWKRHGRPDKTPDIDKLARSTLDGLSDSEVIFGDDKQVVDLHTIEHYVAEGSATGASIHVVAMRECAKPRRRK